MNLNTIYLKICVPFRRRRMKRFYALFRPSNGTKLLDIGGAPNTWTMESSYQRFPVTMINLIYADPDVTADGRFTAIEGDAVDLPFADGSFDIAFSNSVIEHLTTWERQKKFAADARRVATGLWIQTPARSFPLEAHFLAPWFQYWPKRMQRRLARRFTLRGWITKPSDEQIDEMLGELRLLSYKEMRELFPDCRILRERVFGLTKSYVAVRGAL